ncbi:hypothetical protein CASFOL_042661 [Castilleja foliolosa]|uniref:Protein kinase domain-containing protein n=1 Tax=Castilleja foliolosa TaxID=1961234 RepID=A0ABD3B8W4_9LAMI
MSLYIFLLFIQLASTSTALASTTHSNKTKQLCGSFEIPLIPFYLLDYSGTLAFSLSCINSSTLFLNISSQSYRVLRFFPDGVLVDFPNYTNDLSSFTFSGNEYFGISTDNVLALYDCDDSSLCRPNSCLMHGRGKVPSCCYPLSDHSAWQPGESLSVFSQCRGFSSWVVLPTETTANATTTTTTTARRGIKLEWAVPRNSTTCVTDADVINATSVNSGIRCRCHDGFVGDGFTIGLGCRKSCFKDGIEIRGSDCHQNNHGRKKAIILAGGVITSVLAVVSLAAICLLKRPVRSDKLKLLSDQSPILSQKSCRPLRLFTSHELQEATKGFGNSQKTVGNTMYTGVLIGEGSHSQHVAVQRVRCESESELTSVLFRVEALAAVSHRNMARVIGWSIDSLLTPLVVYDFSENRTLREHLLLPANTRDEEERFSPLDWRTRLNIASETATILAFMQREVSPRFFHHDLQSGHIFLDVNFSVKLAGFDLKNEAKIRRNNDVYSFGVILLEIITGNTMIATTALRKIKKGKLEEIVDPSLYYHEQPLFRREQIETIADLATRCVLFGGANGKLGMMDVARELAHVITKEGKVPVLEETFSNSSLLQMISVVSLEETFSNSSLLQMISMSPDSMHVPQQQQ